MRDTIELCDLEGEEREEFAKAIEGDTGYDIKDIEENEPTLIADHYFKDYAQQLANDIGAVNDDLEWPLACIDWEHAVRELQHDYTQFEVNGTKYWFRAF